MARLRRVRSRETAMTKVKFITDSACDLPESDAQAYGIKVLPIPITVDGRGYLERVDFNSQEFYDILKASQAIPTTAHITSLTYLEEYDKAVAQGAEAIIVITISSTGSAMKDAANLAKDMYFDEHPDKKQSLEIYVVDSLNYTMAYGLPIIDAVKLVREGKTARETADYLTDYFTRVEILFTPFTLEYAKKSGRIGVAAAFVGEVLGLRPIISIIDGVMKIEDKVRGDKAVNPRMLELAKQRIADHKAPYLLVRGERDGMSEELAKACTREFGHPPVGIYYIGACIAINSGPDVVGIAYLGKKRR